jgi:hypothetical protein
VGLVRDRLPVSLRSTSGPICQNPGRVLGPRGEHRDQPNLSPERELGEMADGPIWTVWDDILYRPDSDRRGIRRTWISIRSHSIQFKMTTTVREGRTLASPPGEGRVENSVRYCLPQ